MSGNFDEYSDEELEAIANPRNNNSDPYQEEINAASNDTGLNPDLIKKVIKFESGGNPRAQSPTGPQGLMQLSRAAASESGIDPNSRFDPGENVKAGARYYKQMVDKFGPDNAYAAYHDGPGRAQSVMSGRATFSKEALKGQRIMSGSPATVEGNMNNFDEYSDEELDAIANAPTSSQEVPVSQEAPVSSKESVMKGFLQSAGNKTMNDYANVLGAFGSHNPLAQALGTDKFTSPLDVLSKGIKGLAGNIDETQPGTSVGKLFSDVATTSMASSAKVLPNFVMGATHGYATSPGSTSDRVKSGLVEGITQAGASMVPAVVGRVVRGFKPTANAKALMDLGVQPTVGQGAEQGIFGRAIRKLEEAYTSLPFLGSTARMARDRAISEWDNAVLTKIELPSAGITAGGEQGYKAVNKLKEGFTDVYNTELAGHTIPLKPQLISDLTNTMDNPDRYIPPEDRAWAKDFIKRQFSSIPQTGSRYPADGMKEIESRLTAKASELAQKNPELANVLDDAEAVMSQYRSRHLPPEVSAKLKEVDAKYAMFKRVQKASTSLGAEDGKFFPGHLLGAVKAMDKSKDKADFGSGKALLQDIASHGKTVLKDTLGESGTATRSMVAKMATMAGGEGLAAINALPAYAGLLGLSALGSLRPVQKALLGGYKGQKGVSDVISKATRPAGVLGYIMADRKL